jgi:hypothetical protein
MKILRAYAILGLLAVASPVSAQPEGMNNSAGGASIGNIPGGMGSGTATNSPTKAPGTGSAAVSGAARAAAMGTPTPGAGSTSGGESDAQTTGDGSIHER